MDDLISVIINVYNGEKFIKKCLESIINQTYKNLEILVINDGSTDNTLTLCESYNDTRIKIITTPNFGLSKSRNVGIENANGEYLYFIDVDDWIELDTIEYLYNLCKKYDSKMSTCRPIDVYDYNINIKSKKEKIRVITSKEMLKKVLLSIDRAGTIWNKLIKKELFLNFRFEDRPVNDVAFMYKFILTIERIVFSNQIKYYYLRHRNAITARKMKDLNRAIDKYKVSKERYYYLKKIYPNFKENDIGAIRNIIMLYLIQDKRLDDFLEQQNAMIFFKRLFSFKFLTCSLRVMEKIKILVFYISPQFCKILDEKYHTKSKYKM